MNLADVLPENWEKVTKLREKAFYNESLRMLRAKKTGLEECVGCPLFRSEIVQDRYASYVTIRCIFINKCIKQYPRIVDRSDFK